MVNSDSTPDHSGNYYTNGVRRILTKLSKMGVTVPSEALTIPPHEGFGVPLVEFTNIEHAMLDWFDGRDYDQARALIGPIKPIKQWHVINLMDEDKAPKEISSGTICPSLCDALGAVIDACDRDVVRLETCRKDGYSIIVNIDGYESVRIQPIRLEPLNIEVRDRVRTAFKGVREYDSLVLSRAARLPGFDVLKQDEGSNRAASGCMLLGFPGNWAFAMRSALKQVGITVTQSQAQELCAVFFGAESWHQLIKHQNELDNDAAPVAVEFKEENGMWQSRFYHTPEEAIFATGLLVKQLGATDSVVLNSVSSSFLDKSRVYWTFTRKSEMDALPPMDRFMCPNWIQSGGNDYWEMSNGSDGIAIAAQQLMDKIVASDNLTTSVGVIYGGVGNRELLEGLLGRDGIPPEQIIYMGDYALAVSYVGHPDGFEKLTANLQVFKFTESGIQKFHKGIIAMYKANIRVVEKPECSYLEIIGDYGNYDPIEIPFADFEQVKRLAWLTHRDGLYAGSFFDVGDNSHG